MSVLVLAAVTLLAAPMPGDAEAQRFKEYFERGEALFQQGDYGAAIAMFKLADRQRVTPEVAYDLAKCHEKVGDEAFTIFYYRLYMKRAPSAPDTLEVAEKVGSALAKAEADGRGFLELDAPRANSLVIEGRRYPESPLAVFLAPGDYEVSAEFPGGKRTMQVQIRTGKTSTVYFEPVQPPLMPVENALAAELIAKGYDRAPESSASKLRIGSYVVAGVGVAAVVTGIVLGVMSSQDASRLTTDRTLTVSQAQQLASSANGKAIGANILYGVGGAALAGGALMFVFSMPEPGMKSGGSK